MTDTGSAANRPASADDLAQLRRTIQRMQNDLRAARAHSENLAAKAAVMITTMAVLLALSMPWFADVGFLYREHFESISGWRYLSEFLRPGDSDDDMAGMLFIGIFCWAVLLAAFVAGAYVLPLRARWVGTTLCVLLTLLAGGLLILAMTAANSEDAEILAGPWCAVATIALTATAWGFWAYQPHHPGDRPDS